MPKRKENADDSDEDNIVDVDFEFFDPNEIDYIAIKRLLGQLFQKDAEIIDVSALTDLILKQPLVGTTVKTDGRDSDPYAVFTVLNMNVHSANSSIKALTEYCLSKVAGKPELHAHLQSILGEQDKRDGDVGFLVSERLINMPVQVMPHMYRMLADEIQWAIDENEPYKFSHFIIITRTYKLNADDEAAMVVDEENPPPKKVKKSQPKLANASGAGGVFSFHPEDECIQKFASHAHDFSYTSSQPREQDSFGLDVAARLMVIPADDFPALVQELASNYASPA